MSFIEPTPGRTPPPSKIPKGNQDKSAEQIVSSGGLLKKSISNFLHFMIHMVTLKPITGWIRALSEKRSILARLMPIFENAYKDTPEFVKYLIKPALQNLSLQELQSIHKLAEEMSIEKYFSVGLKKDFPKGAAFSITNSALALSFPERLSHVLDKRFTELEKRRILHFFSTIGESECKTFHQQIKQLENAMILGKTIDQYLLDLDTKVQSALMCDQFNELNGDRLSEKDGLILFHYFIDFAHPLLKEHQAFLDEAQKIKNRQPKEYIVLPMPEAEALQNGWAKINEHAATQIADKSEAFFRTVMGIFTDTFDTVSLSNSQIVQYAMVALTNMPTGREIPDLRKRGKAENGLMNEFHVNLPIFIEGAENVHLEKTEIEVYITNPVTFATTTMRVSLPFEGEIPREKAEKYLKLVSLTAKFLKEEFSSIHDSVSLSPQEKEENLQKISKLHEQCLQEFAKTIALNDSRNVAGYETPYESGQMRDYLSDPNHKNALNLIGEKAIFSLPTRKLSLLPNAPEDPILQAASTIDNETLAIIHSRLVKNSVQEVPIDIPFKESEERLGIKKGKLSIRQGMFEIEGVAKYVTLTTEISATDILGNSHQIQRTTYYRLNGTTEETLKQLADSPLLERDLLLAKQEFIQRHVQ
jgi:hypothetical protein